MQINRGWVGDAFKAFAMVAILRPAAVWLPERLAFAVARVAGQLYASLPVHDPNELKVIGKSFGTESGPVLTRAIRCRHFIDFVAVRRGLAGKRTLPIRQENRELLDDLERQPSSYIIATGHFARQPMMALYSADVVTDPVVAVVNPAVPKSRHPGQIWRRALFGQMLQYLERLRPDVQTVLPGNKAFKNAIAALRSSRRALIIAVDAPWSRERPGSLIRDFAGREGMAFSTGTARLARMLQCPIIVCVPIVSPQGEAILKWGPIIRAPDTDDQIFDVGVTNKLLDIIEKEIALRPDQYVIEFMGPRHWNEQENKWEK